MEIENITQHSVLETPNMKLWIENEIMYCEYEKIDLNLAIAKYCLKQRIEY